MTWSEIKAYLMHYGACEKEGGTEVMFEGEDQITFTEQGLKLYNQGFPPWTLEKPTRPGYYWCREDGRTYLVSVDPDPNWRSGHVTGNEMSFSLDNDFNKAEWYGPLEVPQQ